MKRIVILIFTILLLSGCSVNYNLEINNDVFSENIEIGKFDASEVYEFQYLTPYAIINELFQESYKIDYSNQILNLNYTYDIDSFGFSEVFNKCYDLSGFSYDEKYYYIKTSGNFKCLSYLNYATDEVKINIKSNYEVIESNADYVKNDVYTWVVNNDNSSNKPINIVFDTSNVNNEYKSSIFSQLSTFFLVIGAVVIIGIIVFIIRLFGKKNNKI